MRTWAIGNSFAENQVLYAMMMAILINQNELSNVKQSVLPAIQNVRVSSGALVSV